MYVYMNNVFTHAYRFTYSHTCYAYWSPWCIPLCMTSVIVLHNVICMCTPMLIGALQWLAEHEDDPEIDQPYMVKKSETMPKPVLTEEEKAAKLLEVKVSNRGVSVFAVFYCMLVLYNCISISNVIMIRYCILYMYVYKISYFILNYCILCRSVSVSARVRKRRPTKTWK